METETYYDILGLRPDASHRHVVSAFAQVAERYHPRRTSDPSARQRFEEAKAAYETLTDYHKRLRYNIERGLPDPPRHGPGDRRPGVVEELASLIPSKWYVFAFALVGIIYVAARIYARY